MFAKVAVAPEALHEHFQPTSLMTAIHRGVIDALKAHGNIVFRNSEDAKRFVQAAKSSDLPPNVAKLWEVTLVALHKGGRLGVIAPPDEVSISALHERSEIKADWSGKVRLMVLTADGADAIGVPIDEGVLDDQDAGIEVATLHAAIYTNALQQLRDLANSTVFPFDTRDAFWREVLCPIATVSRSATILDKYLFANLRRRAEDPRRWQNSVDEQVVWLLNHLDRSMRQSSRVSLIAAPAPDAPDIDEITEILQKAWGPSDQGRLGQVDITFSQAAHDFPHDRHVRFDSGAAVSISAGFDRLRESQIWDRFGMGWSYMHQSADLDKLRNREEAAARARAITRTVLRR